MKRTIETKVAPLPLESKDFNEAYSVYVNSSRGLVYRGFVGFNTFCDLVEGMSFYRLLNAFRNCDFYGKATFYPFHGCEITLRLH